MTSGETVLWSVVEEHLDEAEFLLEQWLAATRSPRFTLTQLQKTVQPRLVAHLDGLAVGGAPVADKLLWPALDKESDASVLRRAVAVLALLLDPGIAIVDRLVRLFDIAEATATLDGLRLAFELTPRSDVDEPVRLALYGTDAPAAQVALLGVLAARRVDPGPILGALLRSADQGVLRATLNAAPAADPRVYQYTVEPFLSHRIPEIRAAAIRTALTWNLLSGWRTCLAAAHFGVPAAMQFLALLGGADELAFLLGALRSDEQRRAALFALGFSGRRDAVEACLPYLDAPDVKTAKLAVEAIAAITDLPLFDEPFALPSVAVDAVAAGNDDLPPLEEDLAVDLKPDPIDELPLPAADRIRAWWSERQPTYDERRRYIRGKVVSPASVQSALAEGPLWRSGPLLEEISIRSGARVHLPAPRLTGATPTVPTDVPLHRQVVWR